jgi:anti-sigma B factor antagonist
MSSTTEGRTSHFEERGMTTLEMTREMPKEDIVLLTAVGKIDVKTSLQLKATLQEQMQQKIIRIILDLSRIEYISSSGVSALIDTEMTLKEQGGKLVLLQPSRKVVEIFHLMNIVWFFVITENRDDAMKQFG